MPSCADIRKTFLLLPFLFCCGVFYGQTRTIDSLKHALGNETSVPRKAQLYNRISWAYYQAYDDSALFYAKTALSYSQRHKQGEATATAHLQLAEMYRVAPDPEQAAAELALAKKQIATGRYPKLSLRLLLVRGNFALSASDPATARKCYQKGIARSSQNNPLRAEFCLNLARLEPTRAEALLKEGLSAAQHSGNYNAAMTACNNLGNVYAQQQQYDRARRFYEKGLALALFHRDLPAQSRTYLNTGNLFYFKGYWTTAIEYYIKSARLKERFGDKAGIALIHNNIAAIYKEQKRYAESLRYFLKSSRYYEEIGDAVMLAETRVNIAIVQIALKKPRTGLRLLKKALTVLEQNDRQETALLAHITIAFAHSELKDHTAALKELDIARKAALEQDDRHSMAFIENLYGATRFFLGDYQKAKAHYSESYALSKEFGLLNEQQKALFGLYEAEEKTGHYDRALEWFELYQQVEDSLFNTATSSRLAELQEKYEAGQKEREINELNAENKAITLRNKLTSTQLKLSLLIVALVIVVVALLSLYFRQRSKRQRALLVHTQEMNRERINRLISQQEVLTLETAIVAQQAERRKLAGDIHDNIGNLLATLRYQHETARPAATDEQVLRHYLATSGLIAAACEEVRTISHQMATGESFDFHLVPAVEQLVSRIGNTRQFVLEFHHLAGEGSIPRDAELVLYKIIQEMLSNVLKHANARKVVLQINQSAEDITLMLEDDGCGFDVSSGSFSGIGLNGIRERVARLSGTLEIDSRIGHGTTIVVAIPLFQDVSYD